MYSKYNEDCGKNHHCRSENTENGIYYVVSGIKFQNYTSFPPAIDLNFDDDENTHISKGLRQNNKVFGKQQQYYYENDNELDDDDEFELLSKYSSHKHGYQSHDHYKVSDYDYQKQDYQYRQNHRREQRFNHNDNIHQYHYLDKKTYEEIYGNDRIPPRSVHQSSSNKHNFNSNNNNNDNNYYKKCGNHFIGDHQHQSLPTTEYQQIKS